MEELNLDEVCYIKVLVKEQLSNLQKFNDTGHFNDSIDVLSNLLKKIER